MPFAILSREGGIKGGKEGEGVPQSNDAPIRHGGATILKIRKPKKKKERIKSAGVPV